MLAKRLIKSNDAGGGGCTNTVNLYNPFPDGGGVALYQLNGDATDVSGNYDGTATNVTYGTGVFGQAGVFNGSNSRINNSSISVSLGSEFSISLWIKSTLDNTWQTIVEFGSTVNDTLQIQKRGDNNKFRFIDQNGGAVIFDIDTSVATINQWFHYAVSVSSNSYSVYENGSYVGGGAYSHTETHTSLALGYRQSNNLEHFSGSLDQVRIFNRALRPYEVEALYTEEYCTPTIVPSEHFNTVLYTGTNASQDISVGFTPDLVWTKGRTYSDFHALTDSVRGDKKWIGSNVSNSEYDYSANTAGISFIEGGFNNGGPDGSLIFNKSGEEYVSWNFKAGGAAVTNTDGTITSQVSANTEAGFSIVTFTGNGTTASVGHGLGQKPSIIFTKNRSASEGWFTQQYMYVPSGNAAFGYLNTTAAFTGFTDSLTDDTVMQQGGTNGQNYVSYCFAEVEGFSNFGSYVGNGSAQSIVTGFEPAFVMLKRANGVSSWAIADNKRNDGELLANVGDAERIENTPDFVSNGFNFTTERYNSIGEEWIYMAFAADPTTIEPTLEDSFNTVTYTGTNSSLPITGLGFQPDLVWIKNRTGSVDHHSWIDSVRGKNSQLFSNLTNGENTFTDQLDSFDSDGFTVGTGFIGTEAGRLVNVSGTDYVAWNWKGAELPAINSNGSIPSVVSANPAAGFSIVSYTGNGNAATIGHGLSDAPKMIITKFRSATSGWSVYHSSLGATGRLVLDSTNAFVTNAGAWNNTEPTSTVFSKGAGESDNGVTQIAYCFAEVAGFSKFGTYIGNASVNGATVTTGFEPAFVMVKQSDFTNSWLIYDNKRNPTNSRDKRIFANSSAGEFTDANQAIDFNADGFQIIGTDSGHNRLDGTFIYMAFANQF